MGVSKKKAKDVSKFGGVEKLDDVKLDGYKHEASSVEAKSSLNLEADTGVGDALVIRCFEFQMNLEHPELFIERHPSKQDLFNSHIKGIEMALWKDGLKLYTDSAPRITFDLKKFRYSIFVPARPMKGFLLNERPQTLAEIVHG